MSKVSDLKKKHLVEGEGTTAGVMVYPSDYNRKTVQDLFKSQIETNNLVLRISQDTKMLDTLAEGKLIVSGRAFTVSARPGTMYGVLERIRKQRKEVGVIKAQLLRTDYIEDKKKQFKQVEINTISCAFILLGRNVNMMHQEMYPDIDEMNNCIREEISGKKDIRQKNPSSILISDAPEYFIQFIVSIQSEYKRIYESTGEFLLVDGPEDAKEKNKQEKKQIIEMLNKIGIEAQIVTIDELISKYSVKNNRFFYDKKEVSIIYYRWLYNIEQYTEEIVKMRISAESSFAISIPDVSTQIVGLKFFQHLFTFPDFLQKYTISNSDKPNNSDNLSRYFVSFADIEEYKERSALAKKNSKYVLKPLREGGGNNLFGDEVDKKIKEIPGAETKEYVLMEEIEGRETLNRAENGPLDKVIGEIGVFGFLIQSPYINSNSFGGYILRTRYASIREAGVSSGNGYLDSIIW